MLTQNELFCNEEITADEAVAMSEAEWLDWIEDGLSGREDYDGDVYLPWPAHLLDSFTPAQQYGARG